tara:strand:- start:97596 stop:99011 length:1416 start_codon:yes stop_codon:yes gene_type:complete
MRKLTVIIFLMSTQLFAGLTEEIKKEQSEIYRRRGTFVFDQSEDDQKLLNLNAVSIETLRLKEFLARIKKSIINGEYKKARILLLNANYTKNFTRAIQYRYLALINFIEGDYKKSLEYLSKKELQTIQAQNKVCMLKTMNLLILENLQEAKFEWAKCLSVTAADSPTNHEWMNTIVNIKVNEDPNAIDKLFKGISIENETEPYLSLFIKLAIYLNKQDVILPRVKYLGIDAYENVKIRELIGMLYFRNGDLVKAYNLIEDLDTPNADNLKGNIYLAQKKYELAYAQFKLALENKSNSQNALERIIPIAWILKQWNQGIELTERLNIDNKTIFFQKALKAAFMTQAQRYNEAKIVLDEIVKGSRNSQSVEVNQLYTYNSVMLDNYEDSDLYSNRACNQNDGFNCWYRMYISVWKDINKLVKTDKKILENKVDYVDQYTKAYIEKPIQEREYISQKDIEELENANIDLLPEVK